jgi:hypothetical protein
MLSAPIVSILLAKYYQEAFRKIDNHHLKIIFFGLDAIVVILIFVSLFGLLGIEPFDHWSILVKVWVLIVTISILFYSLHRPLNRPAGLMQNRILIIATNLVYLGVLMFYLFSKEGETFTFNIIIAAASFIFLIRLVTDRTDAFKRPLNVMVLSTLLFSVLNLFGNFVS